MRLCAMFAVGAVGLALCARGACGSTVVNHHFCSLDPAVSNSTWPSKRADGFRECPAEYVASAFNMNNR